MGCWVIGLFIFNIDFIGIILSIGDIEEITKKSTGITLVKRDITLMDQKEDVVNIYFLYLLFISILLLLYYFLIYFTDSIEYLGRSSSTV